MGLTWQEAQSPREGPGRGLAAEPPATEESEDLDAAGTLQKPPAEAGHAPRPARRSERHPAALARHGPPA